jgi:hypothetical protein
MSDESVELSSETVRRLLLVFPDEAQEEARRLLTEECGSKLPLLGGSDPTKLERVRFAALKVSDGNLDKLAAAVELAKVDWRDLLVFAGFAHHIDAHRNWLPQ